jgi:hypothetical protein
MPPAQQAMQGPPAANPAMAANTQMQQMGGAQTNPSGPNMAEMMKKQAAMMPQPPNMAGSKPNMPAMTNNPGMAEMMKKQAGMAGAAGPKMAGAPNPNAAIPGMGSGPPPDSKKKKNGGAGNPLGGGNPRNAQANAGGPGGGRMGRGMNPGMGGPPGQMGMGANGGGGQMERNAREAKTGTIEEVLLSFCTAIADDDTATASDFVSAKATGILAKLRDGDMTDEKIEELVELFTPFNELKPTQEQPGGTKRTLRNGNNQVITFTLKKEKDIYKITELALPKGKKSSF